MKKTLTLILLFLIRFSFGQNLVPNPSFEDTLQCPTNYDQMYKALGWSSYRSSPDYFNSCATPFGLSVPSNSWGYQTALDGNAYAFLGTYDGMNPGLSLREFIGIQLIQSLDSGIKYFASVNISRANSFLVNGATNNFGIRFSTVPYSGANGAPVDNFSHIHSDSLIADSVNWTCISGSFIADSAYQFLILGNFYDDQNTDTLDVNNTAAGYYVDKVCVSTDSLFCLNWTGIFESTIDLKRIRIYPNPVDQTLFIENLNDEKLFSIINAFGKVIKKGVLTSESNEIEMHSLSAGIYFLIIDQKKYFKISIIH